MSDATIITLAGLAFSCIVTCFTIWARTRPGAVYEEVKSLRGTMEQMHNTIVSQNATISRQDPFLQARKGDTHKFTQAERDHAAGIKP